MQQVRPSTDQRSHRQSPYANNPLVPLRTRYYLTSHPELPGWRSPAAPPITAFNVTATRAAAFTARMNLQQVATSPHFPHSLSVPNIRSNKRPVTCGFAVVSPREMVLPVTPATQEVRVPAASAWVQRNLSTVPRLHMHFERLDGGLPPLTAPPPAVPTLSLPKPMITDVEDSFSASNPKTPLTPSAEASVIYARSQSSVAVEDRFPVRINPPIRLSAADNVIRSEREPAEITTVYAVQVRMVEPLEWVEKEQYQRVGLVRARTQIYSTTKLEEALDEEQKDKDVVKQQEKVLLDTIPEDKEAGEIALTLSQEISAIPVDSIPLPTSPNSLPDDGNERLTLFRELFEGRPSTRSHTFTPALFDSEHRSLFDVFMLEVKRGSIKSREQALSFIKDELKDSMVSDMGPLSTSRHSPSESTRPSYVLCGAENTGSDSGSFFAFRRRGRNRSLGGHRQGEEVSEASPRLIRSSELKLRPRFADLSSVMMEYPELGPPPTRGIYEELPLLEDPEAEQTHDIGAEEEEKNPATYEEKKTAEIKKEIPVNTEKPVEKKVSIQPAKKREAAVAVAKSGSEPKLLPSGPEIPSTKARKATSFKKPSASLSKPKPSSKTSHSNATPKSDNIIKRSASDTPAIPVPFHVISPFEVPLADNMSIPSADQPDSSPSRQTPKLFPAPLVPFRRSSMSLVPPSPQPPPVLPTEDITPPDSDASPKEKGAPAQSVTWRHLFLREEAQVEKPITVKQAIPIVRKVYDIKATDALEQFTVNMAVSLVTSLTLLFKHRSKGELESIKMRAVLDERRTLQKLTKLRGTTDRSVKLFKQNLEKPANPEEPDIPEPIEKPIDIPIPNSAISLTLTPVVSANLPQPRTKRPKSPVSPISPISPPAVSLKPSKADNRPSSKTKQRSRRASKREEIPANKPEVDRNFLSANIDFELRQIEMMRKLAAGLEGDEGERMRAQGNTEESQKEPGSEEEGGREEKPWKNCREEWEKGVVDGLQKSDVEDLLQIMMKDKNLRDLLPFSSSISYSFARTLDSVSPLYDFTPLNPALDPDLALKQELDLRTAFLQLCSQALKYEDMAAKQAGVLFQAHKDSYLPTELRKEVREAVKKRRYKEKVTKERTEHKHVSLRARVYTTFSGLPSTIRVHSTRPVSEELLVDGFAHRVKSDLEHKERVYLRMKKDENLRKMSSTQGKWSEASLKAGLKSLKSLFRPQTRG